jgi:hypothetical protein
VAVLKWSCANDVALVVGPVTSLVGTVVGAFFGVQVGAQGKERAEAVRDEALAALPKDEAQDVLERAARR